MSPCLDHLSEGVLVLRIGGTLQAKRIQRLGWIAVAVSGNNAHADTLDTDDRTMGQVIGKPLRFPYRLTSLDSARPPVFRKQSTTYIYTYKWEVLTQRQHPIADDVLHTARERRGQRADHNARDGHAVPDADTGDDGDARLPPGEEKRRERETKDTDPIDEAEASETTDRLPRGGARDGGGEKRDDAGRGPGKTGQAPPPKNRTPAPRKKPAARTRQRNGGARKGARTKEKNTGKG